MFSNQYFCQPNLTWLKYELPKSESAFSLFSTIWASQLLAFVPESNPHSRHLKTSQELGNCPMGQSEALLKEKLYWKKGSIERKALLKERVNWNKFQNLVKIPKFGPSSEIWLKFWNLAKYLKFCQKREIWWKFWNLVEILKFG